MFAARTLAGPLRRGAALAAARSTRGAAAAAAVASNDRFAAARGQHLVLSLTGADRVGIVNDFTRTALAHEANVEVRVRALPAARRRAPPSSPR
jgi:glycine cleavage system regulatory protein